MLASEALAITNKNTYRTDAVNYGIKKLENNIKYYAELGRRECTCSFYAFPDTYSNFVEKYGKENRKHYSEYDIEVELKSYFEKNGFRFKRIVGENCDGVIQDPYWKICW